MYRKTGLIAEDYFCCDNHLITTLCKPATSRQIGCRSIPSPIFRHIPKNFPIFSPKKCILKAICITSQEMVPRARSAEGV